LDKSVELDFIEGFVEVSRLSTHAHSEALDADFVIGEQDKAASPAVEFSCDGGNFV
jgi:hypothetical protein